MVSKDRWAFRIIRQPLDYNEFKDGTFGVLMSLASAFDEKPVYVALANYCGQFWQQTLSAVCPRRSDDISAQCAHVQHSSQQSLVYTIQIC